MKNRYLIAILAASLMWSCSLEEKSYSSFTTGKTFENVRSAEMAVLGAYGPLTGEIPGWGYWKLGGVMDISCGTDELYVNPDWDINVANYRATPNDEKVTDFYADIYAGIGRCNTCINRIEVMNNASDADKKRLISEARTLRALYYFDIVNYFETAPLVIKETLSYTEEIFAKNSNPKDLFNQIIEDLKYASVNGAEPTTKGRANRYLAYGLLAKTYMFMGSEYWRPLVFDDPDNPEIDGVSVYQLAVDAANAVINGPYSIHKASNPDAYGEMFVRSTQETNPENIFIIYFDYAIWPTKIGQWLAPNFESAPDDGNQYDPRNNKYWYHIEQGWPSVVGQLPVSFHDNDIRFAWSILPGFFQKNRTFKFYPIDSWRCAKWRATAPFAWGSSVSPTYMRLSDIYLIKAEALNEMSSTPPQEAYDALNEVRSRAKVPLIDQAYLTAVNPHPDPDLLYGMQSGAEYQNDSKNILYPGRHEYYTNTLIPYPTLKHKFRAAIIAERGWELCFERQRWLDLKRWRRLEKLIGKIDGEPLLKYVVNGKMKNENSGDEYFFKGEDKFDTAPTIIPDNDGYGPYVGQGNNGFIYTFNRDIHYRLPIPSKALAANKNLKQNLGY